MSLWGKLPVEKERNRMKGTRIKGSCWNYRTWGFIILFSLLFGMFENFHNKKVAYFWITLYWQWYLQWVGPVLLFFLDKTNQEVTHIYRSIIFKLSKNQYVGLLHIKKLNAPLNHFHRVSFLYSVWFTFFVFRGWQYDSVI